MLVNTIVLCYNNDKQIVVTIKKIETVTLSFKCFYPTMYTLWMAMVAISWYYKFYIENKNM